MTRSTQTAAGGVGGRLRRLAAGVGVVPAAPSLDQQREQYAEVRDRLKGRFMDSRDAADASKTAERDLLASPNADPGALALASRRRNEANGDLAAVEDALAAVVDTLAKIETAIAERDSRAERDRLATQQAVKVDELADAGANLDAATLAMVEAHDRFRRAAYAAIPADDVNVFGPDPLVGEVRSHVLAAVFPAAYQPPIVNTGATLREALSAAVAGLRRGIDGIRAGNVVALRPAETYRPAPVFTEVAIGLMVPAFFTGPLGQRIDLPTGGVVIAEPIAAEAIRRGVAFPAATKEGHQVIAAVHRAPGCRVRLAEDGIYKAILKGMKGETPPDPVDLGTLPGADAVELRRAAE